MSPEIASSIRALLLTIGGGLVTKGYVDDGTLQLIVGGVLAVATLAWSLYSKKGTSGEAQKVAAKVDVVNEKKAAEGGFIHLKVLLTLVILASLVTACAAFGLKTPASNGQRLVQVYVNALAVTAMLPDLLTPPHPISKVAALDIQTTSKTTRAAIDSYWDAAGLFSCTELATNNKELPPGSAEVCSGPNALQILNVVNASAIQLEQFLITHQGGKK